MGGGGRRNWLTKGAARCRGSCALRCLLRRVVHCRGARKGHQGRAARPQWSKWQQYGARGGGGRRGAGVLRQFGNGGRGYLENPEQAGAEAKAPLRPLMGGKRAHRGPGSSKRAQGRPPRSEKRLWGEAQGRGGSSGGALWVGGQGHPDGRGRGSEVIPTLGGHGSRSSQPAPVGEFPGTRSEIPNLRHFAGP